MNESTYVIIAVASGSNLQQAKKYRLKVLAIDEVTCSVISSQWVKSRPPRRNVWTRISTGASSFPAPLKTSTHILWHFHCCLTILWYGNRASAFPIWCRKCLGTYTYCDYNNLLSTIFGPAIVPFVSQQDGSTVGTVLLWIQYIERDATFCPFNIAGLPSFVCALSITVKRVELAVRDVRGVLL